MARKAVPLDFKRGSMIGFSRRLFAVVIPLVACALAMVAIPAAVDVLPQVLHVSGPFMGVDPIGLLE